MTDRVARMAAAALALSLLLLFGLFDSATGAAEQAAEQARREVLACKDVMLLDAEQREQCLATDGVSFMAGGRLYVIETGAREAMEEYITG